MKAESRFEAIKLLAQEIPHPKTENRKAIGAT